MHSCVTSNISSGYACATGGECVNASSVCDGIRHCQDGSDEDFTHALCYCKYYIPENQPHILFFLFLYVILFGLVLSLSVYNYKCIS